jgi:hypothetical protein
MLLYQYINFTQIKKTAIEKYCNIHVENNFLRRKIKTFHRKMFFYQPTLQFWVYVSRKLGSILLDLNNVNFSRYIRDSSVTDAIVVLFHEVV